MFHARWLYYGNDSVCGGRCASSTSMSIYIIRDWDLVGSGALIPVINEAFIGGTLNVSFVFCS